jgi:hydroxypyruvate reductase
MVASGPTYPDTSTIEDASAVIERHGLGTYELTETPKDASLFSHVTNIVLVSNRTALDAMAEKATTLGYRPIIAGDDLTDDTRTVVDRLFSSAEHGTVVLGGGEPRFAVPEGVATGGRNQHTALVAASLLRPRQLFASVASDGMDNGLHGGALVDEGTLARARDAGLDITDTISRSDETPFLEKTGDLLEIGPTGTNVSDLLLLITR